MVLLVQAIRVGRAHAHAVGIVEAGIGGVEAFHHIEALEQRREALAAVQRLMHPAAGHGEVQVLGVARVDGDGVELGPVRRTVLHRAHPLAVLGIVVDAREGFPGGATVLGAEQALGRGAGVPHVGLVGVAGVSQKVWSTERPPPSAALANAGGLAASCQVRPRSVERKMVGPRWPVLAAASRVRPSRGSSTRWLKVWPRKCGPSTRHVSRLASPWYSQAPLRVATSRTTPRSFVSIIVFSFRKFQCADARQPPRRSRGSAGSAAPRRCPPAPAESCRRSGWPR